MKYNFQIEPDHLSGPDPLGEAAKKRFGIDFIFPYQRLVITNILRAAGVEGFAPAPYINPVTGEPDIVDSISRQIVILPTGAGKSLCFMLPAAMLGGPTLVIFPLLSLMADQARRVLEAGMVPAVLRGGPGRIGAEGDMEKYHGTVCEHGPHKSGNGAPAGNLRQN